MKGTEKMKDLTKEDIGFLEKLTPEFVNEKISELSVKIENIKKSFEQVKILESQQAYFMGIRDAFTKFSMSKDMKIDEIEEKKFEENKEIEITEEQPV